MSTIMQPAPASIKVSVEGNVTQAVYDPQQENPCVLLSFCRINRLSHRLGICRSAVAVELHTGKYFSCTMKLKVIDRISDPNNAILGRDWFNLCSTGLEDQSDSAVRLLSSSQWLIFAASPFTAVRTQSPSCNSYDKKICLASRPRDIIPEFEHTISSDANCGSTGSDASGPGAIISSKKSFISTSIGEDCISVKSIGDILTSIENMSKPSLSTLAISHGIKNIAKLSLDHFKNILSDHICSGCCLNSTFEGCIQVMSIFDDNVLETYLMLRRVILILYLFSCYHTSNLFVDF